MDTLKKSKPKGDVRSAIGAAIEQCRSYLLLF